VDDGSDPPISGLPEGVRLVRHETSAGCTATRNRGLRLATSRWRLILDDDTEFVRPDTLERAVRLAERERECGVLAFHQLLPDGRDHHIQPAHSSTPCWTGMFCGFGFMLREDAFQRVEGFDEVIDYYFDEYEFCVRLHAAGYRVLYDPQVAVAHHEDPRGRNWQRIHRLVLRNAWLTILMHYPATLAPAIGAHYLLRFLKLSRTPEGRDWAGVAWAAREIRRLRGYWRPRRKSVGWDVFLRFRSLKRRPVPVKGLEAGFWHRQKPSHP
jgi:GT2 family glycosyltransferase